MIKLEKDDNLIEELTEFNNLILKKDIEAIKVPLEYFKLIRREYKKDFEILSKSSINGNNMMKALSLNLDSWDCKLNYSTMHKSLLLTNRNTNYKYCKIGYLDFSEFSKTHRNFITMPEKEFNDTIEEYLFEFIGDKITYFISERTTHILSDSFNESDINSMIIDYMDKKCKIDLSSMNTGTEFKQLIDELFSYYPEYINIDSTMFTYNGNQASFLSNFLVSDFTDNPQSFDDLLTSIPYSFLEKYSFMISKGINLFLIDDQDSMNKILSIENIKSDLESCGISVIKFLESCESEVSSLYKLYSENKSVKVLLKELSN